MVYSSLIPTMRFSVLERIYDGLVQNCSNSITNTLDLMKSCPNSSVQDCCNFIAKTLELLLSCTCGLVQDCSNSIVNAVELPQSCTKPLISSYWNRPLADSLTHDFVTATPDMKLSGFQPLLQWKGALELKCVNVHETVNHLRFHPLKHSSCVLVLFCDLNLLRTQFSNWFNCMWNRCELQPHGDV